MSSDAQNPRCMWPEIINSFIIPNMSDASSDIFDATAEAEPPRNNLATEGTPSGLERIYDYESGGHHPVHLDDLLHERCKVIHKLGTGGYANVWLCRDVSAEPPRYNALKIIMAEGSTKECPELRVTTLLARQSDPPSARKYFCLPLERFEIQGPNGLHYVFAYPVLGPRVSRLPKVVQSAHDPRPYLSEIGAQVTEAMAALHANGICHGGMSMLIKSPHI